MLIYGAARFARIQILEDRARNAQTPIDRRVGKAICLMATILIAEDNESNRKLIVTLLRHEGHRVLEAGDGAAALDLARAELPDLVIADLMMPVMDGYEFAHTLRKDPVIAHTPVIFYSAAYLREEATALAKSCDVQHFLLKPSSNKEIFRIVNAALADGSVAPNPTTADTFDHLHLRLLTDKLMQKVSELEAEVEERKRAENAVRKSADQYRLLFHSNPHSMFIYDAETLEFLAVNEAAVQHYGYSEAEFLKMTLSDIRPASEIPALLAAVHTTESVRFASWTHQTRSGSLIDVEVTSHRLEYDGRHARVALAHDITTTRRAEAALQRERDFIEAVVNTIGNFVVVLDVRGSIVRMNHACELMTGYSLAEAKGRNWLETMLAPEEFDKVKGVFDQLCSGQFPNMVENLIVRRDGSRRLISWTNTALLDTNGDVEYVVKTGVDITDEKLAERALRASEARIRAIIESVDEIVFEFDAQGAYVCVWSHDETKLARPSGELVGKRIQDVIGAKKARPFVEAIARVIQTRQPESMEYKIELESGDCWFLARICPIVMPDGACQTASMLSRDITERKRTEEALRLSEEHLQLALNAGEICTWSTDLKLGFLGSENYERVLGIPRGLNGQSFQDFLACVHPDDREGMSREHNRAMADRSNIEYEFRGNPAYGADRWFATKGRFLYNESGTAVGASGTIVDISDRKQRESLTLARDAAETANRAKSQFLANMSHELRTPLNAIIGFSEMLQDQVAGGLQPKQARYVDNVLSSGRHLLELVNDILDLAKVESGHSQLEYQQFDALTALRGVQNIVQTLAVKRGVKLSTDTDEVSIALSADEAKFKQIVYNLLSNAIKFTREGGRVQVHASVERAASALPEEMRTNSAFLRVSVSDTGIGILPEDHERIFLEFEQVDSSYARRQQGTGLGLALTRKLVDMHGGRLWVESEGAEGKGSTFTFTIPISPRMQQDDQVTFSLIDNVESGTAAA